MYATIPVLQTTVTARTLPLFSLKNEGSSSLKNLAEITRSSNLQAVSLTQEKLKVPPRLYIKDYP
jgi:hypothetical protein